MISINKKMNHMKRRPFIKLTSEKMCLKIYCYVAYPIYNDKYISTTEFLINLINWDCTERRTADLTNSSSKYYNIVWKLLFPVTSIKLFLVFYLVNTAGFEIFIGHFVFGNQEGEFGWISEHRKSDHSLYV